MYQDITSLDEERMHYSGTIVLKTIKPIFKQYSCAELIDGQQRLTTLIIFISELIRVAENNNFKTLSGERIDFIKRKLLSTELDGENVIYLRNSHKEKDKFFKNILQNNSSFDKSAKLSLYQRNLINARKFISNKIKNLDKFELEKIFDTITNRLMFNILEVNNDFEVCSMFESINYRGKKITVFEGVKNRLIYICDQINNKINTESIRLQINGVWSEAYRIFGLGKNILDEDDFLLYHSIAYFNFKSKESLEDFLLKDKFSIKSTSNSDEISQYIINYIESINSAIKCWGYQKRVSLIKSKSFNDETDIILDKLECLKIPSHFNPIILSSLMATSQNSEEILAGEINSMLSQIERYCFIFHKLINNRSNHNSKIQYLSNEILNKKIGASSVERKILELIDKDESINLESDYSEFHKKIARNSHARFMNDEGWAKWNAIKYLMVSYEIKHFDGNSNKFLDNFEKLTAKRIFEYEGRVEANQKHITNDIGNMTIFSDEQWEGSADEYQEVILDRGTKLIEYIFEHWNIPRDSSGSIDIDIKEFLSAGVKAIK
jgi:uncharacterized protein with ParB-like and HNH nuclease domain